MIKRLLVVCLMAVSGIAMSASPCWACSCIETSKEDQAKNADVVFFGKVKAISGGDPSDGLGDDNIKVRFRVRAVYKGTVQRITTVLTNESGAACGYETFKEGNRYTVFAERANKKLSTNLCSGTKQGNINPASYGLPDGYPPEE